MIGLILVVFSIAIEVRINHSDVDMQRVVIRIDSDDEEDESDDPQKFRRYRPSQGQGSSFVKVEADQGPSGSNPQVDADPVVKEEWASSSSSSIPPSPPGPPAPPWIGHQRTSTSPSPAPPRAKVPLATRTNYPVPY